MSKKRSANDWDVEQYRHPWDSDEQWEVRRQFMFAHKDTIPEDKLVCLAQVFANMEFLQCSYPTEVAEMVNKLAADIDQDYRKSRKEKQGVAFVKASEDSDISKTFKGNQFIDAEASTAPKRPRWEEREQTNRPNNRPSAADYFERNKHTSGESDELERKCSANKYQIQSYYTSTYKSMQRRQNDMPAASAGGPGELPSQRQEIDVRASGFGTMPVGTLQPANVHPNNENPCQNHLTGRTTAFSGKKSEDMELAGLQRQFQNLLKHLSKCQPQATTTRWWVNDCVQRANMKITYPISAVPKPKRRDFSFLCKLMINGVLVASVEGPSKKSSSDAAYELAIKKLLQPDMRIERNIENALVVISSVSDLSNTCTTSPGPSKPVLSTLSEDVSKSSQWNCAPPFVLQQLFRNFILIQREGLPSWHTPVSVLYQSANFNKVNLSFSYPDSGHRCIAKMMGAVIADENGINKQKSKEAAAAVAIEKLRSVAYTLVIKTLPELDAEVSRDMLFTSQNVKEEGIPEDNVGKKLLRSLGWKGGSLGKSEKGPSTPIRVEELRGPRDRQGLGHMNSTGLTQEFLMKAKIIIEGYAQSNTERDLVFSTEFSKEERAQLHKIAVQFGLKSASKGKEAHRHLIVSRRMKPKPLLHYLQKLGGSSDKYQLIPPSNKLST